ncbi:MAG: Wzz/FepE/Etk N-terminal domain-containing protein [Agathobacter sp.]|nr:Wzz/FepE/Etk N-terminal domain-containing protein [Agathobacter sp.]
MENNNFDADNEIEIDLKDLLLELLANWKWIFVALILAGGIGFSVSYFLMTPKYESTAKLYVLSKSTSITSLADIQTGTSLTNDYMVVVKDRPVIDQVIKNLGLNETYASLQRKVSLNNPTNSRILEITVTDENPERAKVIADEIADVASAFIAEKMKQDPPTIEQYGYSDGMPVSPNIVKNTVVGAMFGAIVAMAVIIISYLFNDTVMSTEDIERKLGLNVLGTLPLEEVEYDGEQRRGKKKKRKGKAK